MTIRVAIYARYSSEMQRDESIEDQVRLCRARAEREGWVVTEVYADHAVSGATTNRRRLQALVADAGRERFDVALTEALDRVSRDQEHIAGIWKKLTFVGVKLVTIAEGEITELHVGLKGTMNALFLKDLAKKTHRGMAGRVEAGKSGGGISYGYDVVRSVDERGEPVRGGRTINAEQAAIVRRIFKMFADGSSPIAIARQLNAEGVAGPTGAAWRDTTIRGHALRSTGILRNELYVGKLVWNRMRFLRDPSTGKRVSRLNPADQVVTHQVPELRIVDAEAWEAVQARLGSIRTAAGADKPDRAKFWERRRAIHLLTHKVFCGACGGAMSTIGRDYLACAAARRQGVCTNRQSIRQPALEAMILDALRTRLMAPELVAQFVRDFTAEWNRAAADASADRDSAARELATVERKLNGLINAIADGLRGAGLQGQLDALEGRRAEITARLASAKPAEPRLHPNLSQIYKDKVERLQEALQADVDGQPALEAARDLIDRVVLTPAATGFDIELVGQLSAMLRLAMSHKTGSGHRGAAVDHDLFARSVKVVAGVGFEPTTFRL